MDYDGITKFIDNLQGLFHPAIAGSTSEEMSKSELIGFLKSLITKIDG